jgi:hypothetical protein
MISFVYNAWRALTNIRNAEGRLGKKVWRSKTLWVNTALIVAGGLSLASKHFGWDLPVEFNADWQSLFVGTVNDTLRLITGEPVGIIDYSKK